MPKRAVFYRHVAAIVAALCFMSGTTATAQIRSVDPNEVIDSDLDQTNTTPPSTDSAPATSPPTDGWTTSTPESPTPPAPIDGTTPQVPTNGETWHQDDLIGAAEGVFGRGAEGLARLIENILREQGEPNGYIVGREAGGALVVGLRYGSGTLYHKIEGQMPVYWTGPSIGFDAGANAGNTFVLVYNLHDTNDLFHRIPAGEGAAYLIGGFNASYLRRGDIVLIPIRMGVGARLGVNVGYMKFSRRQRWLPF